MNFGKGRALEMLVGEGRECAEARGEEVVLDLHGAALGALGADALARRHLELGALTVLRLGRNGIDDRSGAALASALARIGAREHGRGGALRALHLEHNQLADRSARALAVLLAVDGSRLEFLDVSARVVERARARALWSHGSHGPAPSS